MNFIYENQGSNTFMVYEVGADEVIDSMSLGMITNNKILGLAPTIFFQQDTTKYFKYNISAKVSADQFLMGVVNKKRLIGVFQGIVNAMLSAEEYMIDANSICLDLQYIFTDVSTCETVLVCLPIMDLEKPPVDLKNFFKNIVFSTQFDQTENCDYVAKLFNHLNGASVFSLTDFKELLDEIEHGATPQPVPKPVPAPAPQPVVQPMPVSQPTPVSQQTLVQPAPATLSKQAQQMTTQSASAPATKPVTPASQQAKQASNTGFAIPGQKQQEPAPKVENTKDIQKSDEKEMSFVYLMRNYTKENAAIYKAQQEAKKAGKTPATPDKKEKKSKAPTPAVPNASFAIPGQQAEPPKQMPNTSVAPALAAKPTPAPAQSAPQVPPTPQATPQPATYTPPTPQPTGMPANFGETTVLTAAGCGETTVLGVAPAKQEIIPYLIRRKNNEKIILNKPVFRVGKERSYVDYFIGDNTAISRSHANIITREGTYFVVDTNSTNHTFVNGNMINSNEAVQINHGDSIRFANEDFEFKLY